MKSIAYITWISVMAAAALIACGNNDNVVASSTPADAPVPKLLANSKYGVFFHYLNDVPRPDTPPKPGGIDNGVWDQTVNGFNIDNFVADVKLTGADYIIFTIGQTTHNFASPNKVLEAAAALSYARPDLNHPGAFTSKRDLVGEIAARMTKEGIAFYAYYPSSTWFDFAPTGPNTYTGWYTPDILTEYAKRWGSNVSGWWIDGCYPSLSGLFKTPELAKTSTDTLVQSVRQGNPEAALFCNSENSTWLIHSEKQTAIGGEEGYFHRLPDQPLTFNGKPVQFHLTTHLGKSWGDSDLERFVQLYEPHYLPRYIKKVSDAGGVVSVDASVTKDGRMSKAQLDVLQAVKRHVKDGAALPSHANLALGKLGYLKSNTSPYITLPPAGRGSDDWGHVFDFFAFFGTNGLKNYFFAAPKDDIAWNFMVDLETPQTFNQVVVTFPTGRFATEFAVETSNDSQNWSTRATAVATNAGTNSVPFAAITARYLRVRAITPNAPNQAGGQMAISELEVYNR